MLQIDKSLSERLRTVNFIATMLVVMCHVDDVFPEKTWIVRFLGGAFTDANISNFFLLSGIFWGCATARNNWYSDGLVKRVRTLLLPYLYWNVIAIIFYLIITLAAQTTDTYVFQQIATKADFGISNLLGLNLAVMPIDGPLWYIRTLFIFLIISPPFIRFLKKSAWWVPVFVTVFILLKIILPFIGCRLASLLIIPFSINGFLAFLLGLAIALYPIKFKLFIPPPLYSRLWRALIALFIWIITAVITMELNKTYPPLQRILSPLNITISIVMLHYLVAHIAWRVPLWMSETTFFTYVVHIFWLGPFQKILHLPGNIFGYCVLLVVTVGFSIASARLLKKLMPNMFKVLTGGR